MMVLDSGMLWDSIHWSIRSRNHFLEFKTNLFIGMSIVTQLWPSQSVAP